MATKKATKEAQKLAEIYVAGQAAMKVCIAGKEEALRQLLALTKPGDVFVIGGVTYCIVDNFALKNTMFKPTAFQHYDLKAMR